jgi:hypothetical protein
MHALRLLPAPRLRRVACRLPVTKSLPASGFHMGQYPLEAQVERRLCFRNPVISMPCCANPRRPCHPSLRRTTLEWSRLLVTLRPWHCCYNQRARLSDKASSKQVLDLKQPLYSIKPVVVRIKLNCVHGFFIFSDVFVSSESLFGTLADDDWKTLYLIFPMVVARTTTTARTPYLRLLLAVLFDRRSGLKQSY